MGMERASKVTAPIAARAGLSDRLFLIADDLTGALDTAAQFASAHRPIDVRWDIPELPASGDLVLSTGTREADSASARAAVTTRLIAMGEAIPDRPFLKLDSLLRGNPATELRAATDHLRPDATIIAPAFPGQGRVTRGGRQYVVRGDDETLLATDLATQLRASGVVVTLCRPGEPILSGISLYDAESDADLAEIVAAANTFSGRILWCGSAGLAKALAGARDDMPSRAALPRPVLGLFGTDHPVTRVQVENCAGYVLAATRHDPTLVGLVRRQLATRGVALVRPDLPEGLPRDEAARQIADLLDDLAARLDPPATLIASGGETLQSLCRSLQADKLVVTGEILPGIPVSRLSGGRFDGVTVISKSGAFGAPDLFQRLLEPTSNPLPDEG
jgi:uncharacterized protein YgbK (DUF1537 family)